jgi:hypothetical protein
MLEDIVVSVDSLEYPTDFMVFQPKSNLGGYPLIFGRPWLATVDAYISCRSKDMTISHESSTKILPSIPLLNLIMAWRILLGLKTLMRMTLVQASNFREDTKDDFICTFIACPHIADHSSLWHILGKHSQKTYSPNELTQQLGKMVPLDVISENPSLFF